MAKAWRSILCALAFSTAGGAAAPAQDSFQGKTLTLLVGAPAGSDYDKLAKLVAIRLSTQLPGKPAINVDNRSSNAGIDALNAFAADSPKDGTALHLLMPGMALLQVLRAPEVRYDAAALGYVGSLSRAPQVLAAWWVTGFKTIDDGRRREMLLGSAGKTSVAAYYPAIINAVLRTRFRVVDQYRRESEIDDAMQNTEIGGRIVSWNSLMVNHPDWIAGKRVNILAQIGLTRHPDLADAPLLSELVSNERDKALMTFVSRDSDHALAMAMPAGTPAGTLALVRRAFDAMVSDAGFLAEARAERFDLAPRDGEATAKSVREQLQTPRDIVERTRAIAQDGL